MQLDQAIVDLVDEGATPYRRCDLRHRQPFYREIPPDVSLRGCVANVSYIDGTVVVGIGLPAHGCSTLIASYVPLTKGAALSIVTGVAGDARGTVRRESIPQIERDLIEEAFKPFARQFGFRRIVVVEPPHGARPTVAAFQRDALEGDGFVLTPPEPEIGFYALFRPPVPQAKAILAGAHVPYSLFLPAATALAVQREGRVQ